MNKLRWAFVSAVMIYCVILLTIYHTEQNAVSNNERSHCIEVKLYSTLLSKKAVTAHSVEKNALIYLNFTVTLLLK
uniref:Uncharacterized protein n=1 Tax=Oncorhynchus tshawytscha TaxID=74940 RepID=A0A8C8JW12_ONCTS